MMHSRNWKIYQEVDLDTLSKDDLKQILKWYLEAEKKEENCKCNLCNEDNEDIEIDSYWWTLMHDKLKDKIDLKDIFWPKSH